MYGSLVGDMAVHSGWMARSQRLLAAVPDDREAGWVTLNRGMFEPDQARKEALLREAIAAAQRVGDVDLEFVTLAYLGSNLVHVDRVEEGMLLLDEALAAVAGHEVEDFMVLEEIFCQLFSACEYAHDVARAEQWIRVGEAIAERRRLPAVSAFCRTHYGGLMTAAGNWPEADAALTGAVRLWGLGQRSWLRAGALRRPSAPRVPAGPRGGDPADARPAGRAGQAGGAPRAPRRPRRRPRRCPHAGGHPPRVRRGGARPRRPGAGPRPGRARQHHGGRPLAAALRRA